MPSAASIFLGRTQRSRYQRAGQQGLGSGQTDLAAIASYFFASPCQVRESQPLIIRKAVVKETSMNGQARCFASPDFGVWWCDPPKGCLGPPWWTIVFLHGKGECGDGSPEMLAKIKCGGGLPGEIGNPDNQLLQDPGLFPFLVAN